MFLGGNIFLVGNIFLGGNKILGVGNICPLYCDVLLTLRSETDRGPL